MTAIKLASPRIGRRFALLSAGAALVAPRSYARRVPRGSITGAIGPTRIVGTSGRLGEGYQPSSATLNTSETRASFYVGVDTPWMILTFDNWVDSASGAIQLPAGNLYIQLMALESDALTSYTPGTFSGSASTTVGAGVTSLCDPIPASAFGLAKFTRGEKYWVRLRYSVDLVTGQLPVGRVFNPPGFGATGQFDPTVGSNSTNSVYGTGAMPGRSGQTNSGAGISFSCVLGQGMDPSIPSMTALSTSIGDVADDSTGQQTLVQGAAFINRASCSPTNTNPVPLLNMARGSSGLIATIGDANFGLKLAYMRYANILINEHGTGDLGSSGTINTVAAIEAAVLSAHSSFRAVAIGGAAAKIIKSHIIPRISTDSDSFQTLGGQTITAAFASNAGILNSWFDSYLLAGGLVDDTVGMLSITDPTNANCWLTNGTAFFYTGEGTHPTPAGSLLMAAELRTKLLAHYPAIGNS